MDLKIASYNIHGFRNGGPMLNSLRDDSYDIIMVQEHWLLPANVSLLTDCNSNYSGFAISGICDVNEYALCGGRPNGGVGILWKNNSCVKCTILGYDDSHRCVTVKIECAKFVLVCINIYLPTYNNSDYYEEDILNCFAFADSIFCLFSGAQTHLAVFGNFNFDAVRLFSCDKLIAVRNLMQEYNLLICDNLDSNKLECTYSNDSLKSESLIDHLFISESFISNVNKYAVCDSGLNFSDHCVISVNFISNWITLYPNFHNATNTSMTFEQPVSYVWDAADIVAYQSELYAILHDLKAP